MSPRHVFLGSIATETNTFSPLRTDLRDFRDSFMHRPLMHFYLQTACRQMDAIIRALDPLFRMRAGRPRPEAGRNDCPEFMANDGRDEMNPRSHTQSPIGFGPVSSVTETIEVRIRRMYSFTISGRLRAVPAASTSIMAMKTSREADGLKIS